MPSILEEVQPSWIEDGWGIQGEQNEVRFDDDIPWDITAWTRDHQAEDSDQLCCAQPIVCPLSVTFSGVEYCCGCIGVDNVGVLFQDTPEVGSLNGVVFPMSGSFGECQACAVQAGEGSGGCLSIKVTEYSGANCTGIPIEVHAQVSVFAALIDGIWYILAGSVVGGSGYIFFYGTTTNPNSPIGNQITDCTLFLDEFDNPLVECLFGSSVNVCAVAIGGTATIGAFPPTGACINGFTLDCTITTEYGCTANDVTGDSICYSASTYLGDGTECP